MHRGTFINRWMQDAVYISMLQGQGHDQYARCSVGCTICFSLSDTRTYMGVSLHTSNVTGPGCVSSLDLLSASGLVNYFGKWTDLTRVEISPLLMQKGVTRLALYGLSHLKDERLARLFGDHRVSVIGPLLFSVDT
jgi:hypothetical protein